jgi:hypothetical protein
MRFNFIDCEVINGGGGVEKGLSKQIENLKHFGTICGLLNFDPFGGFNLNLLHCA